MNCGSSWLKSAQKRLKELWTSPITSGGTGSPPTVWPFPEKDVVVLVACFLIMFSSPLRGEWIPIDDMSGGEDVRFVGAFELVYLCAAFEEDEGGPGRNSTSWGVNAPIYWVTYIALTEYDFAISFAWSTSHFRKLTLVYCFESDSKNGAMAWHGPHL